MASYSSGTFGVESKGPADILALYGLVSGQLQTLGRSSDPGSRSGTVP